MKKLIKNYLYAGLIALMTANFVACQQSTSDSTSNNETTNTDNTNNANEIETNKSNFPYGWYFYTGNDKTNENWDPMNYPSKVYLNFKEDGTIEIARFQISQYSNQKKSYDYEPNNIAHFTFSLSENKITIHNEFKEYTWSETTYKDPRIAQWELLDNSLILKETDDIEYNNSLDGWNRDARCYCGLATYFEKMYDEARYIYTHTPNVGYTKNLKENEYLQQESEHNILSEGWTYDYCEEEKLSPDFDKNTRTLTLHKSQDPSIIYKKYKPGRSWDKDYINDDNGGGNSGNESGSISASDFENIEWEYKYQNATETATFSNGTVTSKTKYANGSYGSHTREATYTLSGNKLKIKYSQYDEVSFTISLDNGQLVLDGGNDITAMQVLQTLFINASGTAKITFTK